MRKHVLMLVSSLCMVLLTVLLAPSRAAAQDQEDQDDPPSRVARLSFARGPVSFNPAGTDDWVDATINRPMTTGDKLWADAGARAAIHIGSASINLSESTGFSFLNLTDGTAQLQLTSGTIRVRVKRLGDQENFEIDTPNLAFTVLRPGVYKISVNDTGDTTVIEARSGQGEVTGGGSAYTVNPGDWDTFTGTDQLSANQDVIDDDQNYSDDFEQWSEQRDHHEDNSVSARYVSDDAIGYDDLDDNGAWQPTPEYGNVWFPRGVQADWAPYHYGHWAYVAPWGYTWVDDAAWGFAPFHYGRWVSVNGAWGWIPCPPRPVVRAGYGGPVYVRPVYAPALVAWVGGPGFGVGVAVGGGGGVGVGVGWFPLGPREVFVPSYHVSRGYVNNVNVSNTTVNTTVVNNYYNTVVVNKTTVNNVTYVNQRVPGAVVATSSQAFSSGQSVSRNVVRVDARQVASAPVSNFTPATVPQREAVLGGRTDVRVRPPANIQSRAVVAKTAPPPPPPAFAQRQEAIKANGGRPISISQARQITPARTEAVAARPQVKVAPPAKPATPQVVKANPNRQNNGANNGRPGQPSDNNNRPGQPAGQPAGQPSNVQQQNNNRPGQPAVNNQQQPNNNRPGQPADNNNRPGPAGQPSGQPTNVQQQNNNRPGQPGQQPAQENANRPGQPANVQPNNNRPGQPAPENTNRPGQPAANTQQQPNNNHPGQPAVNAPAENDRNDRPAQQNNNNRPPQPAVTNQQPPANQNRPNAQPPANTQQQTQDRQRAEQQQQQKDKQQADEANRQRLQQEEQQKQNQQKSQLQQQQQQQQQQREKQQADQANRQHQPQDEAQKQNQQKQQQQQQKEDKKQQDKEKDKDKDKDKPPKPQ
jgi:hypothetical protein